MRVTFLRESWSRSAQTVQHERWLEFCRPRSFRSCAWFKINDTFVLLTGEIFLRYDFGPLLSCDSTVENGKVNS